MEEKQSNYMKISRMLRKRYVIAIAILVLSILGRQVVITYVMKHNEDSALKWGGISNEKVQNSQIVIGLYEQLDNNHKVFMMTAGEMINMIEENRFDQVIFKEKLKVILNYEKNYLEGMERIVNQYDTEAKEHVHQLETMENLLFIILLLVVVFEIIAIYIPTQKTLLRVVEDIAESSRNLMTLIETVNEELFLLDTDTLEIIYMNETARQLLEIDQEDTKKYFSDEIEWGTEVPIDIPNKIRKEEKIKGIEVSIRKKSGEIKYFKLSTVKGNYRRKPAILIILTDITLQKKGEENIRKQAIRDELTGLYNRHFLDEIVNEELARSDRYNFPVSVFIMDIDFFKRVNDTWGHPIGDVILKHTAEFTLKNVRKSDYLIRFGGEEFLLFMPHIDLKHAVLVAEKVRKEIEQYTHPIVGKYTASFGVAERKRGESFQSLYQRADAAMYKAKQEGRNRVVADIHQDIQQNKVLHLDWRAEWNSGNEIIDRQHRELLDMINEIANLTLLEVEEGVMKEKMDCIIQHTTDHFEKEETILQQSGYPYYKNHANVHIGLLSRTKDLEDAYLAGEIKLTAFFTFLLDEVVVGHLLDMDTKFFPYLKKHIEETVVQ